MWRKEIQDNWRRKKLTLLFIFRKNISRKLSNESLTSQKRIFFTLRASKTRSRFSLRETKNERKLLHPRVQKAFALFNMKIFIWKKSSLSSRINQKFSLLWTSFSNPKNLKLKLKKQKEKRGVKNLSCGFSSEQKKSFSFNFWWVAIFN